MFNLTTYPHLVGLFSELGVESERSDMSFALSTDDVEWGSLGLKAVFAQKKNLVSPSFLNMIREILKFGKRAGVLDPSKSAKYESMTLGEVPATNGYSRSSSTTTSSPCARPSGRAPTRTRWRFR